MKRGKLVVKSVLVLVLGKLESMQKCEHLSKMFC